jgi:hypothetical protein
LGTREAGTAFGQRLQRNLAQIAIQQRVAASVLIEHGQNLGDEFLVTVACRVQKRFLLGLGQVCGIMKQILNLVPERAIHNVGRDGACPVSTGELRIAESLGLAKSLPQPCLGRSPVAQDGGFRHANQAGNFADF